MLVTEEDLSNIEDRLDNAHFYLKWDGARILFYDDREYNENEPFDAIVFSKCKPNFFMLDLAAINTWYLNIKFLDGGLVKNRVYNVRDYVK